MSARLIATLVVLVSPLSALAQALADHAPGDTLIYVGWRGADSLGPGYDGSHLKAVLDHSDLPKLFNEFLPKLMDKFGQQNRNDAKAADALGAIGKSAWKHPTALFVGPVDWQGPRGMPSPRAGFLCEAGPDAAGLLREIEGLVNEARREAPFEVHTFNQNGLVGLVVGYRENDITRIGDATLTKNAKFQAALAQAQQEPVVAAYFDAEGVRREVEKGIQMAADHEASEMWPKIRDALGVDGLQQVLFTAGFRGKGWERNLFVAAPQPRKGLLALLDQAPVSDDVLKFIPKTARMAGAVSFDAKKVLSIVRDIAGQLEPRAREELDRGLGEASRQLGVDIEKDLLAAIGNEWAYYVDSNVGGNSLLGVVAVNRLKDAAKAEAALNRLGESLIRLADRGGRNDPHPAIFKAEVDGVRLSYLGTPFISPAWTIQDGRLILALNPQTVAAAVQAKAAGGSILDNPDLVALRKGLTGDKAGAATALGYADLPAMAPNAYPVWLAVSRLTGFADMMGVQSPPALLPPLRVLREHLTPAAQVTWSDEAGWHWRSAAPFPGSELIATDWR